MTLRQKIFCCNVVLSVVVLALCGGVVAKFWLPSILAKNAAIQIKEGMTYEEVINVMGRSPDQGGVCTTTWTWEFGPHDSVYVHFAAESMLVSSVTVGRRPLTERLGFPREPPAIPPPEWTP